MIKSYNERMIRNRTEWVKEDMLWDEKLQEILPPKKVQGHLTVLDDYFVFERGPERTCSIMEIPKYVHLVAPTIEIYKHVVNIENTFFCTQSGIIWMRTDTVDSNRVLDLYWDEGINFHNKVVLYQLGYLIADDVPQHTRDLMLL